MLGGALASLAGCIIRAEQAILGRMLRRTYPKVALRHT
jgi:hypothetical protein